MLLIPSCLLNDLSFIEIWKFHKISIVMGVPLVIIHFDRWDFPLQINHPAFLGVPMASWKFTSLRFVFVEDVSVESELVVFFFFFFFTCNGWRFSKVEMNELPLKYPKSFKIGRFERKPIVWGSSILGETRSFRDVCQKPPFTLIPNSPECFGMFRLQTWYGMY